jgi:hypothetical protein
LRITCADPEIRFEVADVHEGFHNIATNFPRWIAIQPVGFLQFPILMMGIKRTFDASAKLELRRHAIRRHAPIPSGGTSEVRASGWRSWQRQGHHLLIKILQETKRIAISKKKSDIFNHCIIDVWSTADQTRYWTKTRDSPFHIKPPPGIYRIGSRNPWRTIPQSKQSDTKQSKK